MDKSHFCDLPIPVLRAFYTCSDCGRKWQCITVDESPTIIRKHLKKFDTIVLVWKGLRRKEGVNE